jgi:hypothetical protein
MQRATAGDGARGVEHESANGGIEAVAVLGDKKVTAVHGATGCTQAAAAGVLEGFSGAQQGLLTDHAQAFDFLAVTAFVLNDPVARNQLHRHPARVGDRDGVGECEDILQGVALVCHVMGQHINLNGVGGHAHMLTATIQG